jgi:hypothetical protein
MVTEDKLKLELRTSRSFGVPQDDTQRKNQMTIRTTSILVLLLGITSCGLSHPVTRSEATFLEMTPHEIIVRMDSVGSLATSRSLPLGSNVKVTIEGKLVPLEKLREGQRIRISRDEKTHQVVAIDAL